MKKGFSLVEVLISLFVLTAGITAISMLMTNTIKISVLAKNQVIAAGLVQEGIELVRNLKDNNAAVFVANITVNDDDYRIDKDSTLAIFLATSAMTDPDKKLFISGSGYYDHNSGGTATKFYRKIRVVVNANDFEVTSLVGWGATIQTFANCNVANQCILAVSVMPK